MKKFTYITISCMLIYFLSILAFASISRIIDYKSVLAGTVVKQELATVGKKVSQGDVLVMVRTKVSMLPFPAVRCNNKGIVKKVFIKPGDIIDIGQTVVQVEQEEN